MKQIQRAVQSAGYSRAVVSPWMRFLRLACALANDFFTFLSGRPYYFEKGFHLKGPSSMRDQTV